MKYYYSPSFDSFYPSDFKKDYVENGNWPVDLVETSEDTFKEFSGHRVGLVRKVSADGTLFWHTHTPDDDELIQQEISWRNFELYRADIGLYKAQDSDPKAVGSVSDWRSYRKMLRSWPENKNFPDINFRPIAPDFKD